MTEPDDQYGTVLREKLKESMEKPFVPLNRKETRPNFWEMVRDGIVIVAMLIAIVASSAGLWLLLDRVEKIWR